MPNVKQIEPCNCIACKDRCSFFNRLSNEEFDQLNGLKKAIRYRKGETILKKGSYSPYLLLISSGFAKVMIEADFQKRFIMEILGAHNIIASNIYSNHISNYTVVAITDMVVCHLNIPPFIELMEANGRFCTDLLKYMNEHGAIRFHRLKCITLKQSRGKLADVILYIANLPNGGEIFKSLSRKDLAEMANISMENAIRTLREFIEEKLIAIEKKDVILLDPEALQKISHKG
jgi:CRP-like cAMP-binding protein